MPCSSAAPNSPAPGQPDPMTRTDAWIPMPRIRKGSHRTPAVPMLPAIPSCLRSTPVRPSRRSQRALSPFLVAAASVRGALRHQPSRSRRRADLPRRRRRCPARRPLGSRLERPAHRWQRSPLRARRPDRRPTPLPGTTSLPASTGAGVVARGYEGATGADARRLDHRVADRAGVGVRAEVGRLPRSAGPPGRRTTPVSTTWVAGRSVRLRACEVGAGARWELA